ncbi:chemokine XC receptor 1-like [Siphateles boraxobius]|uniref:chemokine XC receptor 1-like n=1 Tax=Siphateles boraxobius TaxID=180520 RepID=UPI004062C055
MELMKNFTTPHSFANHTLFPFWEIGILEMCMLTFSFMSGVSTHSYVTWLIVTGTGSGVLSEFFDFSLSLCGIIFSLYSLLILITKWFSFPVLIALTQFLVGHGITGSPLFQCLMCVERYLAVVHPVTFLKYKPLRYRVICGTAVWIITLGSCFFYMVVFLLCPTNMYTLSYSTQYLLFFCIQLFCLVAVLRALKQSGPGERGRERDEENQMKRRAFHLIVVTIVSLAITYIPFTMTGLVTILTVKSFSILWSISYICFMLANLVQPVHYLHRTGKLFCFCDQKNKTKKNPSI